MARVLLLVAVVAIAGGQARAAPVAPCAAKVHHGVLPVWLRGGFTGPKPRIPYVVGEHGTIAGILFGAPLNAPPSQHKNNKVLWVPRHYPKAPAALWIKLQKMDGTQPVGAPVREIVKGGPGPSYVDAPSAGCWRLTLTWSGRRDTLDLEYTAPSD